MPKFATKVAVPVLACVCALSISACQAQTNTQQTEQEATNTSDTTEETTHRVGKVGIGYVTVPSDWISLSTKSGSGDIEFCDITATKIITMKIMGTDDPDIIAARNAASGTNSSTASTGNATGIADGTATGTTAGTTGTSSTETSGTAAGQTSTSTSTSESASTGSETGSKTSESSASATQSGEGSSSAATTAESDTVTIEEAIQAVILHAKAYDVTDENIQQEAVTLANRDATKLTITYGDGTKVICWLLLDDSGNVRYVAAEAPSDSVDEVASIVESTYSF